MAKITFKGNPVTLLGNEVKVGDQAPDFTYLPMICQKSNYPTIKEACGF